MKPIPQKRLALAFSIAAISDAFSAFFTLAPPILWLIDGATALLLFIALGWRWILLPGLIAEAIPGVSAIPCWLLVVTALAGWGATHPNLPGNSA
jgi:hypothetical protein